MATCSRRPAWEVPHAQQPGGLHAVHGVAMSQARRHTSLTWLTDHPESTSHLLMWASLVTQRVKCQPAVRETWVRSLGSIPGSGRSPGEGNSKPLRYWKIPWTEKPGAGYSPWGHKESDTTEQLHFLFTFQFQVLILYQYTQKWRCTEVKEVGSLREVKFICNMLRLSFVIPFLLCSPPLPTFGDNFRVLKCSPVLFITSQSGNITVEETGCFSIHLACKEP